MAKFRKTQSNFSSGIIGPELRGRIDIGEYAQGCFEIENFYGTEQGGLYSRHGLNYIPLYLRDDPSTIVTLDTVIADCNKQVYFFDIDDTEWIGFVGLSEDRVLYKSISVIPEDWDVLSHNTVGAINVKTGECVYSSRYPSDNFSVDTNRNSNPLFVSNDPDYYEWNVKADLGDTKFLHTRVGSVFIITHTSGKYAPAYLKWDSSSTRLYAFSVVQNGRYSIAQQLGIVTHAANFSQPEGIQNVNLDAKLGFQSTVDTSVYRTSLYNGDTTPVKYTDISNTVLRPENRGRLFTVLNATNTHYVFLQHDGYAKNNYMFAERNNIDFTTNTLTVDSSQSLSTVLWSADNEVIFYFDMYGGDTPTNSGRTQGYLPLPLKFDTVYYAVNINTTANTLQISETPGGTPIDLQDNVIDGVRNDVSINFYSIVLDAVDFKVVPNYNIPITEDNSGSVPSTFNLANQFTTQWSMSEWGGVNGWPKISTAISSRFVLANSPADPTTIWFSLRDNVYWWRKGRFNLDYDGREGVPDYGQYTNEQNNVVASPRSGDAYSYILTDELSREIRWLYPSRNLEFGTDVGEFTLVNFTSGALAGEETTPTAEFQSSYGGVFQNPLKVGNATIFILKDGKTLGRILFDFQRQANSVTNLNVLAPNILNDFRTYYSQYEAPLIKKIEWDHVKRILWVVTTTGDVFSVSTSFNVDQFGWQKHTFRAPCEDILISNITVGKYSQDSPLIVFNNSLEHMVPRNEYPTEALSNSAIYTENTNIFNFHYLDSAETLENFTSPPTTWTFTNPNFENATVHVFADNQYLGEKTLVGFDLVLDPIRDVNQLNNGENFKTITAGFYTKRRIVKTLVYSGSNTESGLEAYKRIDRVEVKFHRSSYAKIGSEDTNLRDIPFNTGSNPLALINYNYIEAFSGNSEPEHTVIIESELPLPVNVLTITTRGVLAE